MQDRDIDTSKYKWCPRCSDWQPRDAFYNSTSSVDGKQAYCKKHQHAYNAARMRKGVSNVSIKDTLLEVALNPTESGK
jgi:hypothetical protein